MEKNYINIIINLYLTTNPSINIRTWEFDFQYFKKFYNFFKHLFNSLHLNYEQD